MALNNRLAGLLGRARAEGDDEDDEEMATESQAQDEVDDDDEEMESAAQDGDEEEDEDDGAPMAEDGDDEETEASALSARRRERARGARILRSDAAAGRIGLAVELAVGTGLSSGQAVALLAKAEKQVRPSRLDKAMRAVKQPSVGPGGAPDKRSGLAAAGDAELKRRGLKRVER